MYIYGVVFNSGHLDDPKHYYYKSKLILQKGGEYRIESATKGWYSTSVIVCEVRTPDDYRLSFGCNYERLVEITEAIPLKELPVPSDRIKIVNFNREKRVTAVKWTDDTVTKVTCQDMDPFDEEKALALCYMKRWCFDNRGCFNEALKKHCNKENS